MPVPSHVEQMAALARRAGDEILRIRAGGVVTRTKADSSPVTAADEAAERIILRGLGDIFPGVPVIAEEAAAAGQAPEIGRRFLLVDPLDGTKSFIGGRDDFTVNIALVENGAPASGVVLAPASGLLLAGDREAGAFRQVGGGDFAPLAPRRDERPPRRAVASLHHRDERTDRWLAEHGIDEVVGAGSSLKLCLLAQGEADIYPRFGPTMEWDIAAGQAVLEAAGGRVLEADTGRPLLHGKVERGFVNPPFIALAPGVTMP